MHSCVCREKTLEIFCIRRPLFGGGLERRNERRRMIFVRRIEDFREGLLSGRNSKCSVPQKIGVGPEWMAIAMMFILGAIRSFCSRQSGSGRCIVCCSLVPLFEVDSQLHFNRDLFPQKRTTHFLQKGDGPNYEKAPGQQRLLSTLSSVVEAAARSSSRPQRCPPLWRPQRGPLGRSVEAARPRAARTILL